MTSHSCNWLPGTLQAIKHKSSWHSLSIISAGWIFYKFNLLVLYFYKLTSILLTYRVYVSIYVFLLTFHTNSDDEKFVPFQALDASTSQNACAIYFMLECFHIV